MKKNILFILPLLIAVESSFPMTVNFRVEHFPRAVDKQAEYKMNYVKTSAFHEMYVNIDMSGYASVGLGWLARARVYMSIVAESALSVNLEAERTSASFVKYQDGQNQIWRRVTTNMNIGGQQLSQTLEEYVGTTQNNLSDEELKQKSINYLNDYLVPNNDETSTPFINSYQYSDSLEVSSFYDQIDKNGICLHIKTDTVSDAETTNIVEVKVRLAKSDHIYYFRMDQLSYRGGLSIYCSDKNKYVPSLQIDSVWIHHVGTNDWACAPGGFQVAINGKYTTWYLWDDSYDNRSHFWTTGDRVDESCGGGIGANGKDICPAGLWCELGTYD